MVEICKRCNGEGKVWCFFDGTLIETMCVNCNGTGKVDGLNNMSCECSENVKKVNNNKTKVCEQCAGKGSVICHVRCEMFVDALCMNCNGTGKIEK